MIRGQLQRDALIQEVITYLKKKLPENQHKLIGKFIEQYYAIVVYEDLCEYGVKDLAGAILSHWNLIYQRKPGESKVHVYNPSDEANDWQSTHTIIDIAHDDMPFLVDSVRMEVARRNISIHFIVHPGGIRLKRNSEFQIIDILPRHEESPGSNIEAPLHFEVNRVSDVKSIKAIEEDIQQVLNDVRSAVNDWQKMSDQMKLCIEDLKKNPPSLNHDEINESILFLEWLARNNFTFLGFRDYELVGKDQDEALRIIENTGLGVLSDSTHSLTYRAIAGMPPEVQKLIHSPQILIIAKTNTKSTVHRSVYTDYIGVKRFDKTGKLIGERRFIGLFTSSAYHSTPQTIPFLRHKAAQVLASSNLNLKSHAGKALINILETFPRDDLFQISVEELTEVTLGILSIQERSKVRLFVRKDLYGRYMSCLVYLPKDRYSTDTRLAIQYILEKAFNGLEVDFSTEFSESVSAKIHYVIRIDPRTETPEYNIEDLEKSILKVTRLWTDELEKTLQEHHGEEKGTVLFEKYKSAFPTSYKEDFEPDIAVADMRYLEKVLVGEPLGMGVYRPLQSTESNLHFKLFQLDETIPLSDVIPILENMGLRVLDERPYEVEFEDGRIVWINDFDMVLDQGEELDTALIKDNFKEAFAKLWFNQAQNDSFNKLILSALLTWRAAVLLRVYAKYLKQISFTFSQNYIEKAFICYPDLVKQLVHLFKLRFDPALASNSAGEIADLEKSFEKNLEKVTSLDEDRIFRCYQALIKATLRTNYFQKDANGNFKEYISLKLSPKLIPDMPLPKPEYEIFVYSTEFEGVHLRSSNVARGGLRWSDRPEDFRTEILGLMKAQSVKNAVIVPNGSKGGFVLKRPPLAEGREAMQKAVTTCYKNFLRGLLDLTDNLVEGKIVPPHNVVRYDGDDPYLVVAADKGTATFSDTANQVAAEYNFWLGDAFASGGSNGYDHKKMAITARGAWESVKRHFEKLDMDPQTMDFTVVGIGDMSGDVFGNGMLLSEHIRLVAAFNHEHIFLDPNPNPKASYLERKRLFNLPRSNWSDYITQHISEGGGVYSRKDKSITVSPQVKALLDIEQDLVTPDQLLRKILCAKVDLLWNGGIGTYVKSSQETNLQVGDKANDAFRVDGAELRCRVVAEGGNLGCTQLGRIEYALNGGYIYTDFIDNSAGVDCSDHEVNLKILLDSCVTNGILTHQDRNSLLASLSDEVAHLVLKDNIEQTKAIDLAVAQSLNLFDLNSRYIDELNRIGYLNRELEYLPSNKQLIERKAKDIGLTAPETAILLAYSKNYLKQEISKMDFVHSKEAVVFLQRAFPKVVAQKFPTFLENHQLRNAIVATQVANIVVNEMGSVFVYRLLHETGASLESLVKAYIIARQIYDLPSLLGSIAGLSVEINSVLKTEMNVRLVRLVRRATRWFLKNYRNSLDIQRLTAFFGEKVLFLEKYIPTVLTGYRQDVAKATIQRYIEGGVPQSLALQMANVNALFSSLDIIQAATTAKQSLEQITEYYFALGDKLSFGWLRDQISNQIAKTHWETLALSAARDDLDKLQATLTISVLQFKPELNDMNDRLIAWLECYQHLVERWQNTIIQLQADRDLPMVVLFIALRELLDWADSV